MSAGLGRTGRYTQTRGGAGPSPKVSKLSAFARGAVSVQERRYGPTPAEMRRCLGNGQCPFCGRKFRNIALHTRAAHGLGADEVKDLAEIPRSRAICSAEYTESCSARSRKRVAEDPEAFARMRASFDPTAPRKFSLGGKLAQRAKREAMAPDAAKRAGQKNTANRRALSAERDRRIVDLIAGGASAEDVREALGVSNATVKGALKFYGVEIDLRPRRRRRSRQAAAEVSS